MDAFYASVEQLDYPDLRGKPVLVGHDGARGVVSAASYEARKFGCRSAQPMAVAKRMCPVAIVMPVRMSRYRELSDQLFDILGDFSPLVEPVSVDEAFVDLTGTQRLLGDSQKVARDIKKRIRKEMNLTASTGLAFNKFLAKLASDLNKPDGYTVITRENLETTLDPLSISRIWGIGPKTAKSMENYGIRTIHDLKSKGVDWLRQHFGDAAEHFWQLASGIDDRAVIPESQAKSIGHEETFGVDLIHLEEIKRNLLGLVESVGRRLRRHKLQAQTVTLKVRFGDFQTITRARTLPHPTDLTSELWAASLALLDKWAKDSFAPVRLIGMQAGSLMQASGQMLLFFDSNIEKQRSVDKAVDAINDKFGTGTLSRGGSQIE
jgi:DNA polymerase-4